MLIRVAVIGGGSWGTTVANLSASNGAPTVLWARDPDLARQVNDHHVNERYLSGFELDPALRGTSDLAEAVGEADLVVMGVPSQGFRSALEEAAKHCRAWVPVMSLTKGLEQGSRLRMTQIINEVMPGHPAAVLTGPNLAKEILVGDAATSVIATPDPVVAQRLQETFHQRLFRVYVNPDVVGCEVAGALKNVIAIAAGICDGLELGRNARAALVTRGLAEISRLGVAMGGRAETFAGLAGLGDLVLTCTGVLSRNREVGVRLALGNSLDAVLADLGHVSEGVSSARAARDHARGRGIEMPITEAVCAVLFESRAPREAVQQLLARDPRRE